MKVYVVTTHYETGDNAATTTVNGVCSTLEKAQTLMCECYQYEKDNNFAEDIEYYDCEFEKEETHCSIFNAEEGNHYVSINITESEVQ